MAVSSSSGRDRRGIRRTLVRDWLPSSRYDLVLAVIPLLYLAALGAHVVFTVPLHVAMVPTSLLGMGLLIDAVYLHPPTAGTNGESGAE